MTTLAKNAPRTYGIGDDEGHIPGIAADIFYDGSAIGDNGSGYGRPLQAGDPFRGFCIEKADNSAGAAGAVNVKLKKRGTVQLSVSGAAITDVGKPVYASDDDTFTLTAGSNSYVGRVERFVSSGVVIVRFDVERGSVGTLDALTDNTNGTADGTVADTSTAVTGVDGTGSNAASKADVDTRLTAIDKNFAEVVAKLNKLAAQLA